MHACIHVLLKYFHDVVLHVHSFSCYLFSFFWKPHDRQPVHHESWITNLDSFNSFFHSDVCDVRVAFCVRFVVSGLSVSGAIVVNPTIRFYYHQHLSDANSSLVLRLDWWCVYLVVDHFFSIRLAFIVELCIDWFVFCLVWWPWPRLPRHLVLRYHFRQLA